MRYLYVPLTRSEYIRLQEMAWAERRSARDHAAVLLVKALGFEQASAPATDHAHPAPPSCASTGATVKEGAPS